MKTNLNRLLRMAHTKGGFFAHPKKILIPVNVEVPLYVNAPKRLDVSVLMKGFFTFLLCSLSLFAQAQPNCAFSISTPLGNNSVTVQSLDTAAQPAIYGMAWDFGDGAVGYGSVATHAYNQSGFYFICCSVYNLSDSTLICSNCQPVTISSEFCSFSITYLSSTQDSAVVVFANSANLSGSQYSFSWDFGDGHTGSGNSVQHTYDSLGIYSVTQSVHLLGNPDSLVCENTISVQVVGPDLPISCDFTHFIVPGTNPPLVALSPISPNASYYAWSVSDGQHSFGQFPSFSFSQPGFYSITLTAASAAGAFMCSHTDTIVIGSIPEANCSFQSYQVDTGGSFVFVKTIAPDSTNYVFHFGDGVVSDTIQTSNGFLSFEHVYANMGFYQACLQAFDAQWNPLCNWCVTVSVTSVLPSCSFSTIFYPADADSGYFPVDFASNSNLEPTQFVHVWDFGDGQTGTGANINHHYDSVGTYVVAHGIHPIGLPDSLICQSILPVNVVANPVNCDFSYYIVPGTNPIQVILYPVNNNGANFFNWTCSDGQSSYLTNPTFSFNQPGSYSFTLTSYGPSGAILCSHTDTILIESTSAGQCGFQTFPGNINGAFAFVNNSPDSTLHYVWNYGDGVLDTAQIYNSVIFDEHLYPYSGQYQACLSAFDAQWNLVCNWCTIVTVDSIAPSMCGISFVRDTINPLMYQFTASSAPSGAVVTWEFPGLGSFSGPTQQLVFPEAWQTYYVCVTVNYNGMTCSNCIFVQPTIYPCTADFMVSTAPNTAFFFNNSYSGPDATLNWDFGDGSTSTEQYPYHVYASPGIYNVCLTVTNAYCQSTYCDSVQILDLSSFPPPNGDTCSAFFVPLPSAGNLMNIVNMVNGSNLQFAWTLNNVLVSTEAFPQFSITSIGNYQLCLTITNNTGCTASYCDSMDVDSADVASGSMMMRVVSPQTLTSFPLSIQNSEATQVAAWPNPVSDELNLSGTKAGVAFRVMSVDGRLIAKGLTKEKQTSLDTGDWLPGLYVVQLQNPDGTLQNIKVVHQ